MINLLNDLEVKRVTHRKTNSSSPITQGKRILYVQLSRIPLTGGEKMTPFKKSFILTLSYIERSPFP